LDVLKRDDLTVDLFLERGGLRTELVRNGAEVVDGHAFEEADVGRDDLAIRAHGENRLLHASPAAGGFEDGRAEVV